MYAMEHVEQLSSLLTFACHYPELFEKLRKLTADINILSRLAANPDGARDFCAQFCGGGVSDASDASNNNSTSVPIRLCELTVQDLECRMMPDVSMNAVSVGSAQDNWTDKKTAQVQTNTKKQAALNWIATNVPGDLHPTEYANRYRAACNPHLHKKQFELNMNESGYVRRDNKWVLLK